MAKIYLRYGIRFYFAIHFISIVREQMAKWVQGSSSDSSITFAFLNISAHHNNYETHLKAPVLERARGDMTEYSVGT